jgi:hypothetical protein
MYSYAEKTGADMKIVINTQIRENYGSALTPYWKFKGGDVYVVPNLTTAQVLKVKESGIPTLTALIETRNAGFEEYVVDWYIADDGDKACQEWETPFELCYTGGKWIASRVIDNDGYMRREIVSKTEQYDMFPGGERNNYSTVFMMRNGDIVPGTMINEYLTKAA